MSKPLFTFAIGFTLACCSPAAIGNPQKINTKLEVQSIRTHWEPENRSEILEQKQKQQRFIIQLRSAPVASLGRPDTLRAMQQSGQGLNHPAPNPAVQQIRQLDAELEQFSNALIAEGIDAQITHRFTTLFNGVAISGRNLDPGQLANISSVKAIFPERFYSNHTDTSPELVKAASIWQSQGSRSQAGKGIKIAIIDSGIYPEHPMFSDEGFLPPTTRVPHDDYCSTVDSTFCNNKLISARWISPTFPVWKDEYLTPRGFSSHGTHVAGIAAGNMVTTQFDGQYLTLSGIAPGAYLMVYKALYARANNPNSASGSNIMLLEALEHAVNDGADVINNSWGGSVGMDPALSPFREAFEMAEAAGIIVVSAAGNSGPGANSIGCPGCIEAGLTVANSSHGRFINHLLEIEGLDPISAKLAQSNLIHNHDLNAPIVTSLFVDPDNTNGCDPFPPNSLQGYMAVVQRGECAFIQKALNLHAAGAVAMIVFNDRPTESVIMLMPTAPIPAAMISQSDGAEILSQMTEHSSLAATLSANTARLVVKEFADHIAPSSSRGPNGAPHILKPDITAPGSFIISAVTPQQTSNDNPLYAMFTGTSMAAPQVSGAAALMRQLYPDWSAVEIKTALTSTSYRDHLRKENNSSPATPFDVGAGRLDLNAARKTTLTFDKASYANPTCIAECQFRVQATNQGDTASSWEVRATLADAELSVSPTHLELAPGQSETVTLIIKATHMEKDRWHFGELTFNDATEVHLPLAILPALSSNKGMTALFGDKPALAFGERGDYHARFSNSDFSDEIAVELSISPSLKLDKESTAIRSRGSSNSQFEFDDETNRIQWNGLLDTQVVAIMPSQIQGLESQAHYNNQVSCINNCDEYSVVYRAHLPFEFNGDDYQLLTISSNGFLSVGESEMSSGWRNQKLPDDTTPNNVIAPFWTDLNLLGDEEIPSNTSGNGTMHIYEVLDEHDTPLWLVVDWIDVQAYGDPAAREYSFGVWFGVGPNKGTNLMNYYELDTLPTQLTVGVEERSGNAGAMRYFNGEGFAPKAGEILKIKTHPAGQLEFDFVLANEAALFDGKQQMQIQEDMPLSVDATELHSRLMEVPVVMTVNHLGSQLQAMQLIELTYPEVHTSSITRPPENGNATLDADHQLSYQPNPDFNGEDSLQYMMLDGSETPLGFIELQIQVTNVNDPPVAEPVAELRVNSGETVHIPLSATDVDSENLSWGATQLSGPSVHFALTEDSLTLSAPETHQDEVLTFAIIASDGQLDSDPITTTIVVAADTSSSPETQQPGSNSGGSGDSTESEKEGGSKGGGSLNTGFWLLPLLITIRRRRPRQ